MSLIDQVAEFKAKQIEIINLNDEAQGKLAKLQSESQAKLDAVHAEFETEKAKILAPLDQKREEYKKEMKAAFGVTEGETATILDLVQLIHRVTHS